METEAVALFLSNQSLDKLEEWQQKIDQMIKEKIKISRPLTPPGTETFKHYYEKHKRSVDPEFDASLVKSTARSDGGFEGTYIDLAGNYLHAKTYVTWRLGDYDMFTDVHGCIGGKRFNESN